MYDTVTYTYVNRTVDGKFPIDHCTALRCMRKASGMHNPA